MRKKQELGLYLGCFLFAPLYPYLSCQNVFVLQSLYKHGLDAYESYQWSEQIVYMSAALDSYHDNYNNCSLMCEAGFNVLGKQDRNHEVVGAIAGKRLVYIFNVRSKT